MYFIGSNLYRRLACAACSIFLFVSVYMHRSQQNTYIFLLALHLFQILVFLVILGDRSSDLYYSLCAYKLCAMSYPPMALIIIRTMTTHEYLAVHHLVISLLLGPIFKPAKTILMDTKQQTEAELTHKNRDVACRFIKAFQFGQRQVCRYIRP